MDRDTPPLASALFACGGGVAGWSFDLTFGGIKTFLVTPKTSIMFQKFHTVFLRFIIYLVRSSKRNVGRGAPAAGGHCKAQAPELRCDCLLSLFQSIFPRFLDRAAPTHFLCDTELVLQVAHTKHKPSKVIQPAKPANLIFCSLCPPRDDEEKAAVAHRQQG